MHLFTAKAYRGYQYQNSVEIPSDFTKQEKPLLYLKTQREIAGNTIIICIQFEKLKKYEPSKEKSIIADVAPVI